LQQVRAAVALSDEPGDACPQFVVCFGDHLKVGTCLRFVEADDHIAVVHAHPVMHQDLRDDAAGRVLNFLHVRFGHQRAGHHDGS
jgi:hypothetical protein